MLVYSMSVCQSQNQQKVNKHEISMKMQIQTAIKSRNKPCEIPRTKNVLNNSGLMIHEEVKHYVEIFESDLYLYFIL